MCLTMLERIEQESQAVMPAMDASDGFSENDCKSVWTECRICFQSGVRLSLVGDALVAGS